MPSGLQPRARIHAIGRATQQAVPKAPAVAGSVKPLEEIEKSYILAVLDLNQGNRTHTAAQLGIGSATLYRKLRSYRVGG